MERRKFLRMLGGAASALPLAARAQPSTVPSMGFLNGATPGGYAPYVKAFLAGLNQGGYVDGESVRIDYRWAELIINLKTARSLGIDFPSSLLDRADVVLD